MKRIIYILPAMILFCCLALVNGCDKGESLPEKKVEAVKQAPLAKVTPPPSDKDIPDDSVSSNETDIPEVTDSKDIPAIIHESSGIIEMKNEKAVLLHKMGIVMFTHEKHFLNKPEGHGIKCGECHHDAAGKPLVDLKVSDPVLGCFECHNKKDRPRKPQDISDQDWLAMRLKYYVEVMHDNCIECHKKQSGPVKCADCHPKIENSASPN